MKLGFQQILDLDQPFIYIQLDSGRKITVMDIIITFTYGDFSFGQKLDITRNEKILSEITLPKSWEIKSEWIDPTLENKRFLKSSLSEDECLKPLPRYCLYVWLFCEKVPETDHADSELAFQCFEEDLDLDELPRLIQEAARGIDWNREAGRVPY